MNPNFEELMSKKTDEQLLRIVASPAEEYQPAALDAAKREFDRRNISRDRIGPEQFNIAMEREREIEENEKEERLHGGIKFLGFILPGIELLFAASSLSKGQKNRAWELLWLALFAILMAMLPVIFKD